jgi:hypothetical protein
MPTWMRWTRRSASCGQQAGPPPRIPTPGGDTELDGRENIADRLSDEVSWRRQCAGWLAHLEEMSFELGDLPPDGITDPAVRTAISARHDSIPA